MIELVKAVQTCYACPSQWDVWDAEGNEYYLRYRWGHGSISHAYGVLDAIEDFEGGDGFDGIISLEDFINHLKNFTLSKDLDYATQD